MYLIKTEFVKLRRCNILWVGIITLLCAPLLSILQQQSLNDPVDNYGYVNLVNGTIWNNMSFFLPVTLMLLGGYMISREYTDDTLKEIFIIPLSYSKLMAGKIGALLILSVFYSLPVDQFFQRIIVYSVVVCEWCQHNRPYTIVEVFAHRLLLSLVFIQNLFNFCHLCIIQTHTGLLHPPASSAI